ncbi:helix-turn-helix domain-containing protein [Actinokineospora enzanensis]|uniref:helix-turn-helix domain-containing protein n=1 Tax=Actinokineospora enzanensis TaxID=155975 RepID=UPI0012EC61A3|nr:helix-turn-helix transcriptional regulator [Actinokineospora enzanensis]
MSTERKRLGKLIRAARQANGMNQATLAEHLGCSQPKIHKIEAQTTKIVDDDLEGIIRVLAVPADSAAEMRELHRIARETVRSGPQVAEWFTQYKEAERRASRLCAWHGESIPGPLQGEPYVLKMFLPRNGRSDEENLEALITARRERGAAVADNPGGSYRYVLSEAAVWRTIGFGRTVALDAVEHMLRFLADNPHTEVRVLLYHQAGSVPATDFTVMDGPDDDSFVYVEGADEATYLNKPDQISRYRTWFDEIWATALDGVQTIEWLRRVREARRDAT